MAYRRWEFETREHRQSLELDGAWACPLCGEILAGKSAPEECPVCLAPGSAFRRVNPERYAPAPREWQAAGLKPLPRDAGKDGTQWTRSIKNSRLWAHPRPA
jgi:hypothetical protein